MDDKAWHNEAIVTRGYTLIAADAVTRSDMSQTLQFPRIVSEAGGIGGRFERTLHDNGLFAALGLLNGTTPYRFTGIYRFAPGLVKSVVLYDREAPNVEIGEDVPWYDSYCMIAAEDGSACEIQNSVQDSRLTHHAARLRVLSYAAVLLRTRDGDPLGTLCHYDVTPRQTPEGTFDGLFACR